MGVSALCQEMKILYVCSADLSGEYGSIGSVRHIMEVSENLLELGHDLVLLAPRFRKKYQDITNLRITYVPLIPLRFLRTISYELIAPLFILYFLLAFRPDIVYWRQAYWTVAPVLLAKFFRKKIIVEVNGVTLEEVETEPLHWLRKKTILAFESFNYRNASHLIVVAPRIKEILLRTYGLNSAKVTPMLNGVNTSRMKPLPQREVKKKLGISPDCEVVGFVGYLFPWSGIEILIDAAPLIKREIPNTKFLVIGHGIWGEGLPALARSKGVEKDFMFTGKISWTSLPIYLNTFDIGVAPYTKEIHNKSGSSLKILEYFACGKPVVTTDTDSIPEVVTIKENGLGIAVPPEDAGALAEAIVKLLKDKVLLQMIGMRCRSYVEKKRSWRKVAEKTSELMREVY